MDLSIRFNICEKKIDEKARTVVAGVLQENILSANKRFYPSDVVRKAIGELKGKRSLIGHDTDNPQDIVAVIERSEMRGSLGIAEFRFGTDDISDRMFTKIKEGLVDSVSIRGSGETKRAKIGEEFVDVVEKLEISSVDWVVEGGVSVAKVEKVFESSPTYKFIESKGDNHVELAELQKQIEEQNKKLKELEEAKIASDKAAEESKKLAEEQKLNAYKQEKLASIKSDDLRAYVKENLSGKDEKEIDANFSKHVSFFEKFTKANKLQEEIVINPSEKKVSEDKPRNLNDLLESKTVDSASKLEVLTSLLK